MRRGCERNRYGELLAGLFFLLLTNVTMGWAQQARLNLAGSNQTGPVTARSVGNLEDWSSLSLANSELVPEPPLLGEKYDNPQFTRELLQVKWRQGDPIDLYVIRPKGAATLLPFYISTATPPKPKCFVAIPIVRMSPGAIRCDWVCVGSQRPSIHQSADETAVVSELQEALGSSVHDVQMILNYLATRGDLDMSRIGMFGVGSGGTLSAILPPRLTRVSRPLT